MINLQIFLLGLLIVSTLTSLATEAVKKILSECKKYLNDKFLIAFEIGYQQSKSITEFARTIFKTEKIITEKDLSGKDRYIFIISE